MRHTGPWFSAPALYDCAQEKLVAFSCKRRGFCPACGARRRVETAAHRVDRVLPRGPVRQWVLSFPIPRRLLFASPPQVLAPVLQVVHRVIATFLIQQAGLKRPEAHTGAVTLRKPIGSAANLNIPLHGLVLDGVYSAHRGRAGIPRRARPDRGATPGLTQPDHKTPHAVTDAPGLAG